MKLKVLAFATAAQALGGRELDVDLEEGSRIEDLHRILTQKYPDLVPLWPRMAIAINGVLASEESLLPPDAEIALLPPVSGGNLADAELVDEPIDIDSIVAAVQTTTCGAVVTFIGTVRDKTLNREVDKIYYDAYRPMAMAALRNIARSLAGNSVDLRTKIVHRLGNVQAGEASVVIAVGSPHRAAAYEASREALERIKTEVPIWKEEHYADGSKMWREEERLTDSPLKCTNP